MKKSFKKVVAILLAVMMIVCSVPLTVFASDDANRANINLQFGDVSCTTTKKTVLKPRSAKMADYLTHSGLNSDKLTYSNGKIDGYATGDFFTVSVLLENVTELSAAEVAIKYSEAIEPAYIIDYKGRGDNVTVAYMYNEVTTEGPHADFPINEAIPTQSGNALYNSTSTLGETSYVDPEARIMHANFAVQTGADSVSLTDSKAVLATFMFKIVNDQPITFSIDNTQSDPYETYTLGTIANGGKVEEYKTYAKVSETDVPALDFMGENEYNGTVGKNYTITFVDADGQQISSAEYKEGTAIVPPSLPATTHDDAQHYTYAWDNEVPATATANGTYTIIKTGAAHTWDAGVVTTEPTTTTTGVKTYTCTFDGCGATRTEELPKKEDAHVHSYVWTYNGDATNSADGTMTGKCSCGETVTKTVTNTRYLRARTISLNLGSGINVKTGLRTSHSNTFDRVWAVVSMYDASAKKFVDYEVEYEGDVSGNNNIYYFTKSAPQNMNDQINITFHAEKDGCEVWGTTYEWSVATYLYELLGTSTNEKEKTFIVDMLNYGAAAQTYANYNTANPVNANLTDEQKAYASKDDVDLSVYEMNATYKTISSPTLRWRGYSVTMSDKINVLLNLACVSGGTPLTDETLKNYQVKIEVVGGEVIYMNPIDNEKSFYQYTNSSGSPVAGRYYFKFNELKVAYIGRDLLFTICDKEGNVVSNTFKYSVGAYAKTATGNIKTFMNAVMIYGRSGAAYANLPFYVEK